MNDCVVVSNVAAMKPLLLPAFCCRSLGQFLSNSVHYVMPPPLRGSNVCHVSTVGANPHVHALGCAQSDMPLVRVAWQAH